LARLSLLTTISRPGGSAASRTIAGQVREAGATAQPAYSFCRFRCRTAGLVCQQLRCGRGVGNDEDLAMRLAITARLFGALVAAAKRLQSGRLDAYLLYMLIALVAVTAVAAVLA
jgi:hypothetical protein